MAVARIGYRMEDSVTAYVPAGVFAHGILESAPRTRFVRLPVGERLEDFRSGTLFGTNGELRWRRRRNGRYHLVLIEEGGAGGAGDGWKWEDLERVEEASEMAEQMLLWGEPQDGLAKWYEPRIPRIIDEYPKELKGKRVAIGLRHYRLRVRVPVACPTEGMDEETVVTVSRFDGVREAKEAR